MWETKSTQIIEHYVNLKTSISDVRKVVGPVKVALPFPVVSMYTLGKPILELLELLLFDKLIAPVPKKGP